MDNAILQGVLLGLILSTLIGPIFFLLIQTSINYGIRSALILEAGVIVSDALCISLAFLGMFAFFTDPAYTKIVGISGGIILIIFGTMPFLFGKKIVPNEGTVLKHPTKGRLFLKGLILNITNPFVIIFWIGSLGIALSQYGSSNFDVFVYYASTLTTYFLIDVLKVYLARKIKNILKPRVLSLVDRVASIGLIIFGCILILRTFGYYI
jgi:threonine/homoserine/homoserine lactone efflux protein